MQAQSNVWVNHQAYQCVVHFIAGTGALGGNNPRWSPGVPFKLPPCRKAARALEGTDYAS